MVARFLWIVFLLGICCQPLWAESASHDVSYSVSYFREASDTPLSLSQVKQRFQAGRGQTPKQDFLSLGVSKRPTWVRLQIQNLTTMAQQRRLDAGQPWVDNLTIYLINHTGVLQKWVSGDHHVADQHLLPGVGFVFDMTIPPGKSELYIRGQSLDPLTLPIALLTPYEARSLDSQIHLISGIVYGILLALVGFNLILYSSLKQLDTLYYSIYISCFIIVNPSYNGYWFAWVYPNSLAITSYFTLIFMILHGVTGLIFVSNFLQFHKYRPKLNRGLQIYSAIAILTMAVFIITDQQLWATTLAFKFLAVTTLLMIFLGILHLKKTKDAWYFLIAISCSMLGLLITTLSVWGVLPYNYYSYNGAVFGVLFEAIILAMIVAYRLKAAEKERVTAEYLSAYDPLTNLLNRRTLMTNGTEALNLASHSQKPLSFVMMDLDHFKNINDSYGHQVGDAVLTHIAKLLKSHSRETDLLSRWGGEEMVILLPNTDAAQAHTYTEHLRLLISQTPLNYDDLTIKITASFGIATRTHNETLDELYQLADKRLYQAKHLGRNRVESAAGQTH